MVDAIVTADLTPALVVAAVTGIEVAVITAFTLIDTTVATDFKTTLCVAAVAVDLVGIIASFNAGMHDAIAAAS